MAVTETLSIALPEEVEALTREMLQTACDRELKLGTAESCTGGLLASLFTDVEGCSHAFERGFITYTDDAKTDLLGVPKALLEEKSAVSREVAIAMAEGAVARAPVDIAVSTTGFAGRAGPGDEAGLVHFGCARRGYETLHRVEHFGDIGRGPIRIACLKTALSMIREIMN